MKMGVLLQESIQRSYRNVATAGVAKIRKLRKARKKAHNAAVARRRRRERMRLADDRKYVMERARRLAEAGSPVGSALIKRIKPQ